jgi:phosphoenolpyruvate synthase/pyruvate phosphate dikinase
VKLLEDKVKPFYVLALADTSAVLDTVGGKGMSLSKLVNAGFPVPGGFHITTEAYRAFIKLNNLQTKILATLKDVNAALPASLETASATISRLFAEDEIPPDIATDITNRYIELSNRQSSIKNQ